MQATRSEGLRASLPLPPLRASRLEFGLDDLHDLRAQGAATATAVGLSPGRVSDLVAAASELAANSVLHGGGRGLATIWGDHGVAFVEVADAAEQQDLQHDVIWVHRGDTPAGRSTALLDAIKAYTLPHGTPKVWCAGESLAVRGLREHLRDERGLPIGPLQAIGYWKHRDTPDDVEQ